jgi:hypothetical protein
MIRARLRSPDFFTGTIVEKAAAEVLTRHRRGLERPEEAL